MKVNFTYLNQVEDIYAWQKVTDLRSSKDMTAVILMQQQTPGCF